MHDVIGRPKIVLHKPREGLATLDFGVRRKENPQLCEKLFVPISTDLSGMDLVNVLDFPVSMSQNKMETRSFLRIFLLNSDGET